MLLVCCRLGADKITFLAFRTPELHGLQSAHRGSAAVTCEQSLVPLPVHETQPFKHTASTEGPVLSPYAGAQRLQHYFHNDE